MLVDISYLYPSENVRPETLKAEVQPARLCDEVSKFMGGVPGFTQNIENRLKAAGKTLPALVPTSPVGEGADTYKEFHRRIAETEGLQSLMEDRTFEP